MDEPVLCIHRRPNSLASHNTFLGQALDENDSTCDVCQAIGARRKLLEYRYTSDGALLLDPGTGHPGRREQGLADEAQPGSSKDSRMKLPNPNTWPTPTFTLKNPPQPYTDENIDQNAGWYDINENEYNRGRGEAEKKFALNSGNDDVSKTFNDAKLIRLRGKPNMPWLSSPEHPIRNSVFFTWFSKQINSKISFPVICGENGETYHGLFAAVRFFLGS
jgi:hypothetical protein